MQVLVEDLQVLALQKPGGVCRFTSCVISVDLVFLCSDASQYTRATFI